MGGSWGHFGSSLGPLAGLLRASCGSLAGLLRVSWGCLGALGGLLGHLGGSWRLLGARHASSSCTNCRVSKHCKTAINILKRSLLGVSKGESWELLVFCWGALGGTLVLLGLLGASWGILVRPGGDFWASRRGQKQFDLLVVVATAPPPHPPMPWANKVNNGRSLTCAFRDPPTHNELHVRRCPSPTPPSHGARCCFFFFLACCWCRSRQNSGLTHGYSCGAAGETRRRICGQFV